MKIGFLDGFKWDYNIETAYREPLAGTQSAVCYLAEELAQLGHEVFLFNHTSREGMSRGVMCLWRSSNQTNLDIVASLDILVIISAAGLATNMRSMVGDQTLIILWSQVDPAWPTVRELKSLKEENSIDAFVFVSEWQRQTFHQYYGIGLDNSYVLRNAIAPNFTNLFAPDHAILSSKKQPPILTYTSVPYRGLDILLKVFPKIRQAIPNTRLKIFSSMKVYQYSDEDESTFFKLYHQAKNMPGVEYIGSIPRTELVKELLSTTALAYPNTFAETSCIAVMEAMASGCRIITSNLGALSETTAGFADLIPVNSWQKEAGEHDWERANHPDWKVYVENFLDKTIASLQEISDHPEIVERKLRQQVEYINKFCTWSVRAQEWVELFVKLANNSNSYQSLNARAQTLLDQGNFANSLNLCHHAIKTKPKLTPAYQILARNLEIQGNILPAMRTYDLILKIEPNLTIIKQKKANLTTYLAAFEHQQGATERAINYLEEAIKLDSIAWRKIMHATILPRVYKNRADVQLWRQRLEQKVAEISSISLTGFETMPTVFFTQFLLPYQGYNDREIQSKIAQLYGPLIDDEKINQGRKKDKIYIGFLSSFFYNHSVYLSFGRLIEQLPKQQFHLTIIIAPDSESDDLTTRIKTIADQCILLPKDLNIAREQVRELELDILVYPEIGMDAFTYILAMNRLAPKQCVLAGHPVTTGIPVIDYYISSDLMEISDAQSHYTETLVKLKGLPVDYIKAELPTRIKSRQEFNLPINKHLYTCPMTLIKIHPEFDVAIANILREDPQGEIIFFTDHNQQLQEKLQQRWQNSISDIIDRIKFIPWAVSQDFINILLLSDVILDTFHFSGLNTALIAMVTGTPMVTLPSPYLRGRFCYGIYERMGIKDCVANSQDEYVKIAVKIACNQEYRDQIKQKILQRNHLLYNNQECLNQIIDFFVGIMQFPNLLGTI